MVDRRNRGFHTGQALRQQVQDQAAVEYRHWIRQQRHDAYAALLEAHGNFLTTIFKVWEEVESARAQVQSYSGTTIGEAIARVAGAQARVAVAGPDSMEALGMRLVNTCVAYTGLLDRTAASGRPLLEADFQAHTDRVNAAHDAFQREARQVLERPHVP